ncbi:zinc ribbon domain-containing protein [Natrialba magadii]|uniref:zinc ribbon domain-containing protein n=1 Tax=Natrialba magadii TaxID=13769 RepID=UPI000195A2F1|nr:zinc ribbon domain-containing protein [Natrialba magadii]
MPRVAPEVTAADRTATATAIGVDLGEYNLYTACPATMPDWKGAYAICGDDLCTRLDELRAQVAHLLGSEYDRETITAYVEQRRTALLERLDDAARTICDYASAYDRPVLVTENSHFEPDLWAWLTDPNAHRGTAWLLPAAQLRLRAVAAVYAIEVTTVPVSYSSQECHACGVIGERAQSPSFRCTNPDCAVGVVSADHNAAKVLAQRYYPGQRCAYQPSNSDTAATDTAPAPVPDGGSPQ